MNMQLLKTFIVASIIAFAGCDKADKTAPQEKAAMPAETSTAPAPMAEEAASSAQEKPSMSETSLSTLEATVTAIDQTTRAVTLQDAEGNSVSFIADDDVKNLAQVEVGDMLTVEYLEGVTIQVVGPEEAEVGAVAVEESGRAAPGEKPGAAAASEMTLVLAIEAIDKENEQVTLKGPQGNSKIVQVRNPENLEKVAVGDKVMITFTEAIAISVTEKEK